MATQSRGAIVAAEGGGVLLFMCDNTLLAQRIDLENLRLEGERCPSPKTCASELWILELSTGVFRPRWPARAPGAIPSGRQTRSESPSGSGAMGRRFKTSSSAPAESPRCWLTVSATTSTTGAATAGRCSSGLGPQEDSGTCSRLRSTESRRRDRCSRTCSLFLQILAFQSLRRLTDLVAVGSAGEVLELTRTILGTVLRDFAPSVWVLVIASMTTRSFENLIVPIYRRKRITAFVERAYSPYSG